jgi:hypothetical protein
MFDYHRLRFSILKRGQYANNYSLRGAIAGLGAVWWMFSIFLGEALRNGYAVLAFFSIAALFLVAYVTEDFPRFGRLIVAASASVLCALFLAWYVYVMAIVEVPRWRTPPETFLRGTPISRNDWFAISALIYLAAISTWGIRNHMRIRQEIAESSTLKR